MGMLNTALAMIIGTLSSISVSCVHFGNRNIVSSERLLSPFEKVNSGGNAEVRFHESQEYRAVITVDSNLEEFVDLKTRNGTLHIGTKPGGSYSFSTLLVDVYCPRLSGVSISGSGNFTGMDKITSPSFESNVSGSGNIEGTVECDNYYAVISGSGKITITGTGSNSNIRISGSGDFHGFDFRIDRATAHISGSGKMNIWAMENIDARVSGSGSIVYRGNPKIAFSGSGSGKIKSE